MPKTDTNCRDSSECVLVNKKIAQQREMHGNPITEDRDTVCYNILQSPVAG